LNIINDIFLHVAGFNIHVFTENPELQITVDPVYKNREISKTSSIDLNLRINYKCIRSIDLGRKVFSSGQIPGSKNSNIKCVYWEIFRNGDFYYAKSFTKRKNQCEVMVLKFNLEIQSWDIYISSAEKAINPFGYPMGSLILYYLAKLYNANIVHASGIFYQNNGFIFSGISGSGKSTIAKIFKEAGGIIINDDLLCLRTIKNKLVMCNTPVYNYDTERNAEVSKIFLIRHNNNNIILKLPECEATARFMTFFIQQNYSEYMISKQLNETKNMTSTIPVYELGFVPTRSVIDHVMSF